jgi:TnpA family transposase
VKNYVDTHGQSEVAFAFCHLLGFQLLNVVEQWNSANSFIFYGKNSEIATNRLEDQEIAVLSLHLLQICLVYINTLMMQQICEKLGEIVSEFRVRKLGYSAFIDNRYQQVNKKAGKMG